MRAAPTAPRSWRAALQVPLWLGSLGAAAFGLGIAAAAHSALLPVGAALAALGGSLLGLYLRQQAYHPLRTAANVLEALRRGDYALRARTDVVHGAVADLLGEINHLAQHLQAERARGEETSALLQALVERVDVALLAFDEQRLLRWWNPAAEALFPKLRAQVSARELGAEELLAGPSERSVGLPGHAATSVWELRRGVFHRARQRYQFLLLSSAQRVRREEERAAWQRLVRVLGHEVNNTLAPIQSLATTCRDMLGDEGEAAVPQVRAALEVMEHRAASLNRFISEFARLARLPEPRLEPLELAAQLRCVALLDARCPVRVIGKGVLEVLADGPLLEQALVNLIRNAIDATVPRGGEVTIDWSVDASQVVLSIVDEGGGVSNPDNLFVPLFSTKPGGSGIGLVLARNIVEAHGGQLRLDNRQRVPGCVARVTLPRAGSG